jgi:hypothetical protein
MKIARVACPREVVYAEVNIQDWRKLLLRSMILPSFQNEPSGSIKHLHRFAWQEASIRGSYIQGDHPVVEPSGLPGSIGEVQQICT